MIPPKGIELRSKVLEQSIELESVLSDIIKTIINVKKDNSKTLGNLGSSFSLSDKNNLLYDLGWFKDIVYKRMILFMEIRNQFVHVKDSDSFIKVMEFSIVKDKRKKFLELDTIETLKKQGQEFDVNDKYFDLISQIQDKGGDSISADDREILYYMQWIGLVLFLRQEIEGVYEGIITLTEWELESHEKAKSSDFYKEIVSSILTSIGEFASKHARSIDDSGFEGGFIKELYEHINSGLNKLKK